MILRIRYSGATHTLSDIRDDATLEDLKLKISNIIQQDPKAIRVKVGFPPQEIIPDETKVSISDYGIKHGESLIIEAPSGAGGNHDTMGGNSGNPPAPSILLRREMPDDNSCLFNAIAYVLENKDISKAGQLRSNIAKAIESNMDTYNEALLGQPPLKYIQWISLPNSWGGGIELSIFAQLYQTEIVAVDIQTCRIDRFGEDASYPRRVFVIYNGIHYDALALASSSSAPGKFDTTIFPSEDEMVLAQALSLAAKAQAEHKFTDLANFTLRCSICKQGLVGQTGAQEHANKTGHQRFQEYT